MADELTTRVNDLVTTLSDKMNELSAYEGEFEPDLIGLEGGEINLGQQKYLKQGNRVDIWISADVTSSVDLKILILGDIVIASLPFLPSFDSVGASTLKQNYNTTLVKVLASDGNIYLTDITGSNFDSVFPTNTFNFNYKAHITYLTND